MENNIVTGFQNLRVFSSSNIIKMDELVQDLSNALEETSKNQKSQPSENMAYHPTSRRCHKKRRGKKRRPNLNPLWRHAAISEASESSVDEALLNQHNMNHHSDSDEFVVGHNLHQFTMPMSDPTPPVESDSVTENFSPIRPNRRRRKFKSMAVDPVITSSQSQPCLDGRVSVSQGFPYVKQQQVHTRSSLAILESVPPAAGAAASESITPGKRKRSSKSRSDNPYDRQDMDDCMEVSGCYQESASSISSSDSSDGSVTNDEAREGDDEQSDFFQEPGAACGVAGLVGPPWWEDCHLMEDGEGGDGGLERGPYTLLRQLPHVPQRTSTSRFNRLLAGSGREIRLGRRNLNGKLPNYTMNSYLQDQKKWSMMQGNAWLSCPAGQASDFKRRRKTPPSSPLNEGFTGEGSGANLDGATFSS